MGGHLSRCPIPEFSEKSWPLGGSLWESNRVGHYRRRIEFGSKKSFWDEGISTASGPEASHPHPLKSTIARAQVLCLFGGMLVRTIAPVPASVSPLTAWGRGAHVLHPCILVEGSTRAAPPHPYSLSRSPAPGSSDGQAERASAPPGDLDPRVGW